MTDETRAVSSRSRARPFGPEVRRDCCRVGDARGRSWGLVLSSQPPVCGKGQHQSPPISMAAAFAAFKQVRLRAGLMITLGATAATSPYRCGLTRVQPTATESGFLQPEPPTSGYSVRRGIRGGHKLAGSAKWSGKRRKLPPVRWRGRTICNSPVVAE